MYPRIEEERKTQVEILNDTEKAGVNVIGTGCSSMFNACADMDHL
jgi:hypothetical protein